MFGMYHCSTNYPRHHMHLSQTNILTNPNSTSPRVGRDTIIGRNQTFKAVWGILRKWWKTENPNLCGDGNLQQTLVSKFNVDVKLFFEPTWRIIKMKYFNRRRHLDLHQISATWHLPQPITILSKWLLLVNYGNTNLFHMDWATLFSYLQGL